MRPCKHETEETPICPKCLRVRASNAAWSERNQDEIVRKRRIRNDATKAERHDYYMQNRERILAAQADYCLRKKAEGPPPDAEARRTRSLVRRYGITMTHYESLWRAQEGRCGLCQLPVAFNGREAHSVVIDHCHLTNRIRGLLCQYCNTRIGAFGDDPNLLRRAAEYLELCRENLHGKRKALLG